MCKYVCFSVLCITFVIVFFSTWDIITGKSQIPKVHMDVALTQFTLSPTNNTLYYNLQANITFRNPYSKVGIKFYKTNFYLMYQGQRLGTKRIPDAFYLTHKKEKSIVNVVLGGQKELELINGDERFFYASDTKNGFYNINLKLRLKMKYEAMRVPTGIHAHQIMCHDFEVPLSSESNVSSVRFDITGCSCKIA
ncbi:NDR1/HIN1-like protein 3 [Rutidosis leptorrhynchoides]|uniref:NDR1/HIN1-like protein 3 n=1 Tax=Rutidosis leptorrhynchoides TaxID=125765 RepID=UPI003A9A55B5